MGRGPKPTQGKVKPAASPTSRKNGAEVRDLEKRLTESLEREKASGEILRVIYSSPASVQPTFEAIARAAMSLCKADIGALFRFDGQLIHVGAFHGTPEETEASRRAFPQRPSHGSVTARAILAATVVQIDDVSKDPEAADALRAFRTVLSVPMIRDGRPLGAITVARRVVRPFSDEQIELLKTFANQAVIAIENVRLFNETKEALDRQTATSEILSVISTSPTDVQPVFDAIARHAVALCSGVGGIVVRYDGTVMRLAAYHNVSAKSRELHETEYPCAPDRTVPLGAAIIDRTIVHVPNLQTSTQFAGSPVQRSGRGSMIVVPLLCHGEVLGAIGITRDKPQGFSDRDLALLQTFADQAVIAIENVRLFKELEARNHALSESLDQQTATSEILRVISSSPTDTRPVFDAIADSAARLCSANDAQVLRVEGDILRLVAACGATSMPSVRQLTRGHLVGRAVIDRQTIHVRDLAQALAEYPETTATRYGIQSALAVPLMREGVALGVIRISRTEIRPFTDKQIALLKTFADQAVIAIENVRLFAELQEKNTALTQAHAQVTEALEQQTATSEILGVISSSPTDVQPVFDTIVRNAVRLCGAIHGGVYTFDGEMVHARANEGYTPEQLEHWRSTFPRPVTSGSVVAKAIRTNSVVRVDDLETAADFEVSRDTLANLRVRGSRSLLAVPMSRRDQVIGAIALAHGRVGAFSETHVELLKTFADQAVIAIENVRLFKELQAANRELAAASQHKSEFLANMSHELRTPLNAIIGFSEVLSEKMFGELNEKQEEYSKDIHASGQHLLSLINDILDLSKIEAGRMELELSDFHLPTALDRALTLVRERAGRRGIALRLAVDERLGQIQADERKVRQVVLNLLSNAIKFTPESGRIEVRATPQDGLVEVSVSDTGVGIAPEDQEAVFEEFRQVGTADKKVEGTGLGLTLCRKFVELHGGKIWIKSELGKGSTFTFTIPVRRGE